MRFLEQIGQEVVKHRKAKVGHQNAMQTLTGMKTQQYNRLENGADVRLSTLLRVTDALELEIALVPRDRMLLVDMILNASSSQLEEYKQFMLQQLQYDHSSTETSTVTEIDVLIQDLSDD